MWENNLWVSDVEGYKRKKGVGRYWKYIKLCAALLLYLAAVRSNAHVQARAGYAGAMRFCDDPQILGPLQFLREREIVHYHRFGEALNLLNDFMDAYESPLPRRSRT